MSERDPEDIEWIGGSITLPNTAEDEGIAYKPQPLVWLGADAAFLGVAVGHPIEVLERLEENLRETIAAPQSGEPHKPTRSRVASDVLQRMLAPFADEIEIVHAPTPELDAAATGLAEQLAGQVTPSYLSPSTSPERVRAFFDATAAMYRAAPWSVIPTDASPLSVSAASMGMNELALAVVGQLGQERGLLLFETCFDFEQYLEAVDAMELGDTEMPGHFMLHYARGADLDPALRKQIVAHAWPVADAQAYPWFAAVDLDGDGRGAVGNEVTMAEAIARALTTVITEDPDALRAAWSGGPPVERTLSVPTEAGKIEVLLRAPHPTWAARADRAASSQRHRRRRPSKQRGPSARPPAARKGKR